MKNNGFTLAEVLITLGVIGIVAAITMPTLMQALNRKVRAEQIRTVKYKFTQATDKMNSLGLIGPYDSTSAFVAELQKHLKIAKVCNSSNLRACWPYDKVILQDGKEYEISKVQTGKQFKMNSDENNDYSSPNVGIVTADGTPMILSYNKKCSALDPVKQYGWTTEDNKPVSNATAGCVAAVFEINGTKKPNKQNEDVILFNANGLGSNCVIEIEGKCFTAAFSPAPVTKDECLEMQAKGDVSSCSYEQDYWAGAVKQCKGKSKMPTSNDLAKIASSIYVGNPNISVSGFTYNLTYRDGTASSKGLPEPPFYMWTGEERSGNQVAYRGFYPDFSDYYGNGGFRKDGSFFAVCLSD